MNKLVLIGFLVCVVPVRAIAEDVPEDGIHQEYYDSGKIKAEYHYQYGQLNGPAKLYYENGFLREESFYKNGKLQGVSKKYYTNELLSERAVYNNGVLVGPPFKFEYRNSYFQQDLPDQGQQERKAKNSAWWIIFTEKQPGGDADTAASRRVEEFIKARLMFAGIPEADYTLTVEQDRILVRVSSLFNPEDFVMLLSSSGVLYFKGIESDPSLIQKNTQKPNPEYEWIEISQKKLMMEKQPWLTVQAVETADFQEVGYNKKNLLLKFKKAEAEILEEMTEKHVGEQTALVIGDHVIAVLDVDQPLRLGELTLDSELLSENMQKVVFSLVFSPDIPVNFKIEEAHTDTP
ncbi:MAG: hypothetical protein WC450_07605 [Candidatus Omnitrophota bacterium]|jgi:hypothetical protein